LTLTILLLLEIMIENNVNLNFSKFVELYDVENNSERAESIEVLKTLLSEFNKYIPETYKSKIGVGIGRATPTPWIGFRDPSYSKSFTKGIYIFYSLSEDKKFIYLSVGQGTYELKKEVGGPAARKQLLSNTASIQHILKDTIKAFNYDKSIDLRSGQQNAKLYEDSVFLAKSYSTNKLPEDDIIIKDFKNILKVYPLIVKSLNSFTSKLKIGTSENTFFDKIAEEISYQYEEEVSDVLNLNEKDISTEDAKVAAKNASKRVFKENKLDKRFIKFITLKGVKAYHTESVDIVIETNNEKWFIESKILKTQTTAAHAMGQVMFYSFKDKSENNLIALLFDKKPKKTTCDFLSKNQIPFIWESEDEFKFNGHIGEIPLTKERKQL
jgi:hypothetical protein